MPVVRSILGDDPRPSRAAERSHCRVTNKVGQTVVMKRTYCIGLSLAMLPAAVRSFADVAARLPVVPGIRFAWTTVRPLRWPHAGPWHSRCARPPASPKRETIARCSCVMLSDLYDYVQLCDRVGQRW
jgi:hypothetical protein